MGKTDLSEVKHMNLRSNFNKVLLLLDKEKYEEAIGQTDDGKLPDLALKQCKNALKSLDNVNVKPLVETSNTIAEKKLNEISDLLTDIILRVEQIKLEMNKKNEK